MAVTHSRYKFITVSILERSHNDRFTSAVSEAKPPPGSRSGIKYPLGLLGSSRYNIQAGSYFQGGDDGGGYRNVCKIPRGSNLKEGGWYSRPLDDVRSQHSQYYTADLWKWD